MSGLGFALDKQAAEYKTGHQFLHLAYARGYTCITSYYYFNASGLSYDSPSDVIEERLAGAYFMDADEVATFEYKVDYLSQDGTFAIFGITPK